MTTDTTELAQSLKAAANTTADAIDRLKAFPGDELIDLSQHEGEQVDIDITTLNEWYELSSPANILALVEALEKAQQRNAELESRTVNVKLPATIEPTAFSPWVAKAFYQFHKDTVKSCFAVFSDACAAAGIKVEAE
ncbi:hypothetical protein [Klebsiella pneumoniae]|uniref:hypothetical protein n=1 Tax=Klebsiella pneumoniae TaxID=573 RepID=UPI000E2CDBCB|nr:hypothetical protein [Klebsiella pneumoniae]SXM03424.1 Uncharacterised protein [Klebsiella pneumoniae]